MLTGSLSEASGFCAGVLDLFPTRQESAFAMLLHHAPTQYPAKAARQWSCSPVDPAEYPARAARQWIPDPAEYPARAAGQWIPPSIPPKRLVSGVARQWIPPSIPPERLASGSRQVSRQSGSPVDPAEYPARAARQWIPDPAEYPARADPAKYPAKAARQWNCSPVDPAEYPSRAARQRIPPSIPPERLASGSRRVSRQSCSSVDPGSRRVSR